MRVLFIFIVMMAASCHSFDSKDMGRLDRVSPMDFEKCIKVAQSACGALNGYACIEYCLGKNLKYSTYQNTDTP